MREKVKIVTKGYIEYEDEHNAVLVDTKSSIKAKYTEDALMVMAREIAFLAVESDFTQSELIEIVKQFYKAEKTEKAKLDGKEE